MRERKRIKEGGCALGKYQHKKHLKMSSKAPEHNMTWAKLLDLSGKVALVTGGGTGWYALPFSADVIISEATDCPPSR